MITQSGAVVEKLAKQYNCAIWETKDGLLVPLVLMGERHLRNAHRYVVGKRYSYLVNQVLEENLDRLMASDWDEWAVPYSSVSAVSEMYTILIRLADENIQALQAEAERRGITLEGSVDYGNTGDTGRLGTRRSSKVGAVTGYCRKIAGALRLPYLGIRRKGSGAPGDHVPQVHEQ